ncbi:MAG TPA: DUF4340 domain-containing protein [Bacteroidetes bacterium]|nr:DUF4340 domain-containing protein [Bacteroidota bacterium]
MNNKVLLIILVALAAVLGLSKIFSDKADRTFDPEIIKVDKDAVNKIVVKGKTDEQEAVLTKTEEGWNLSIDGKTYPADVAAVEGLLTNMASVKTDYIAAKSPDKWTEYELGNDQATHVTVYAGDKILADFYVGKFSVDQQARQVTSFFRLEGKDDVYAVSGMAGFSLSQGGNAYRNKKLLDLDIAKIESLTYTGDKQYEVAQSDGLWVLDGDMALDSAKVKNFLMNLRSLSGDAFVDFDENLNSDKLLKKLTINGSNMEKPVVVRCWKDDSLDKPFVIQSDQFPQSFFASDSTRLFTRLFKPVEEW